MKITKQDLQKAITLSIQIRDRAYGNDVENDVPLRERLERDKAIIKLINIAECLADGTDVEVTE